MKKLTVLLCSGLMVMNLAACSNNDSKKDSSSKETKKTEQVAHKKTKKETKKKTAVSTEKKSKTDLGNSEEFSMIVKGAQSQLPSLKEKLGSIYKDLSIEEGKDSTMICKYTFAKAVNQEIDAEGLKSTLVGQFKTMMDGAKEMVPDLKIEIHYLNPDGSDVASFTITPEDTDKVE